MFYPLYKVMYLVKLIHSCGEGNGWRAMLSNRFGLPSAKDQLYNGKQLLPVGTDCFLLEWTSFQKGFSVQKKQTETNILAFVKYDGK